MQSKTIKDLTDPIREALEQLPVGDIDRNCGLEAVDQIESFIAASDDYKDKLLARLKALEDIATAVEADIDCGRPLEYNTEHLRDELIRARAVIASEPNDPTKCLTCGKQCPNGCPMDKPKKEPHALWNAAFDSAIAGANVLCRMDCSKGAKLMLIAEIEELWENGPLADEPKKERGAEVGRTCDECAAYRMVDGLCRKRGDYHKSCGEHACIDFELAPDLRRIEVECRIEEAATAKKVKAVRADELNKKVESEVNMTHTHGRFFFEESDWTIRVKTWGDNPFMGDYRGCIIADMKPAVGHGPDESCRDFAIPEMKANAMLFVAAPELLAAAWLALEQLDQCASMFRHDKEFMAAREALSAAANKAAGESRP